MKADQNLPKVHPLYAAMAAKWARMRDVVAGSDAVHEAGEKYLPKLSGQTAAEYNAYNARANWYGATGRTVDSLHGLVVRKSPVVTAPASASELAQDLTLRGRSVALVASDLLRELLTVGRAGILADYPRVAEAPANAAQAAALSLRPYARMYAAEEILDWAFSRVGGMHVLSMVKLAEDGGDTIRVLGLVEGTYTMEVWQRPAGTSEPHDLVATFEPLANGKPLQRIPFVLATTDGLEDSVPCPPLLDLADLNLSHYRTSADLEHGAHFTGLPTPYIAGHSLQPGEDSMRIGSTAAWVFPDPNAKAAYLEFTGQGLGTLEKLLDRKESLMASLGARMLVAAKAGVESGAALEIRTIGETSMLAALSRVVSATLTRVLQFVCAWHGAAGDASVECNTDFALGSLSAQEVQQLVSAWQLGAISFQTLHYNLARGELVPEGVTADDELARIGDQGPALSTGSGA